MDTNDEDDLVMVLNPRMAIKWPLTRRERLSGVGGVLQQTTTGTLITPAKARKLLRENSAAEDIFLPYSYPSFGNLSEIASLKSVSRHGSTLPTGQDSSFIEARHDQTLSAGPSRARSPNESHESDEIPMPGTESPQRRKSKVRWSEAPSESKRSSMEGQRLSFYQDSDIENDDVFSKDQHDFHYPNMQNKSLVQFGREIASDWDMIFPLANVIGFLIDLGMDIVLALQYFYNDHIAWFLLTITFVFLPSLFMSIFSLVLWVKDRQVLKEKKSAWEWFMRILSSIFLIAPIMRMWDTFLLAYKSRSSKDWYHRRKCYERMLDEYTDLNLVRLFETFMENAPQLILQLYVMTQLGTDDGTFLVLLQCCGLMISWVSMSLAIVSFHTALRNSLPDKAKMTFCGQFWMFLWRMAMIAPRVIALALFASAYSFYVIVFCAVHYFLMFIWISKQDTSYCQVQIENEDDPDKIEVHNAGFPEFCFRAMMAFVHIFCFMNMLEGYTRLRCGLFYFLMYCENIGLIIMWYVSASTGTQWHWFQKPALGIVIVAFFVGILLELIYYKFFHPNNCDDKFNGKQIKNHIPISELSLIKNVTYQEYRQDKAIKKKNKFNKRKLIKGPGSLGHISEESGSISTLNRSHVSNGQLSERSTRSREASVTSMSKMSPMNQPLSVKPLLDHSVNNNPAQVPPSNKVVTPSNQQSRVKKRSPYHPVTEAITPTGTPTIPNCDPIPEPVSAAMPRGRHKGRHHLTTPSDPNQESRIPQESDPRRHQHVLPPSDAYESAHLETDPLYPEQPIGEAKPNTKQRNNRYQRPPSDAYHGAPPESEPLYPQGYEDAPEFLPEGLERPTPVAKPMPRHGDTRPLQKEVVQTPSSSKPRKKRKKKAQSQQEMTPAVKPSISIQPSSRRTPVKDKQRLTPAPKQNSRGGFKPAVAPSLPYQPHRTDTGPSGFHPAHQQLAGFHPAIMQPSYPIQHGDASPIPSRHLKVSPRSASPIPSQHHKVSPRSSPIPSHIPIIQTYHAPSPMKTTQV